METRQTHDVAVCRCIDCSKARHPSNSTLTEADRNTLARYAQSWPHPPQHDSETRTHSEDNGSRRHEGA